MSTADRQRALKSKGFGYFAGAPPDSSDRGKAYSGRTT